jgi:DNA-binding NtrC family response regulator
VIIATSHGSTAKAVQAIREGAFDFLEKPFGIELLRVAVANALAFGTLSRREEFHRAKAFDDRYGADDPFATLPQAMREVLRKAAPTRATILLSGETGAGKEHAAATIHAASPRAKAAFVALNCAAIPAALAESELFGHERGAFTGATSARPGKFEIADGGTLFLDEIGELPLELQPKLLRALDSGEVIRIGARAGRRVDARILAATNRDLEAEVKSGRFREDLYFRLNVLRIQVPALRETRERIPALATLFLNRAAGELRRRFRGFSPDALALFATYSFPGNVRELANAVERAAILEEGPQITAASLGLIAKPSTAPQKAGSGIFRDARDGFEREYFRALLEQTGGNQSEAARVAGMHRNNLRAHLIRLGLADDG